MTAEKRLRDTYLYVENDKLSRIWRKNRLVNFSVYVLYMHALMCARWWREIMRSRDAQCNTKELP